MGNRFRDLPGYQSLVQAHGAIAAIVFLLLVPTAITVVRFYQSRRRRAIHIHIWIQILVVFLLTVVLILGWFAVGPERSLTNPHHGIGVAIYTLVMVQVIGGAIVRRLEKWKDRDYLSVKVMVSRFKVQVCMPTNRMSASSLVRTSHCSVGARSGAPWSSSLWRRYRILRRLRPRCLCLDTHLVRLVPQISI